MHIRRPNFSTKRLGHHARTFVSGAGTALDKAVGMSHHYFKNVDANFAGAIGGALGHDAAAVTKTVSKTQKNLASYEELRRNLLGAREGV
jgi:hypothetical protein